MENAERRERFGNQNLVESFFRIASPLDPTLLETYEGQKLATVLKATSLAVNYARNFEKAKQFQSPTPFPWGLQTMYKTIQFIGNLEKPDVEQDIKDEAIHFIDSFAKEATFLPYIKDVLATPAEAMATTEPILITDREDLQAKLAAAELLFHDFIKAGINDLYMIHDPTSETKLEGEVKQVEIQNALLKLQMAPTLFPEKLTETVQPMMIEELRNSIELFAYANDDAAAYGLTCEVESSEDITHVRSKYVRINEPLIELLTNGVIGNAIDANASDMRISFDLMRLEDEKEEIEKSLKDFGYAVDSTQGSEGILQQQFLLIQFFDNGDVLGDSSYSGKSVGESKKIGGTGSWGPIMKTCLQNLGGDIYIKNFFFNQDGEKIGAVVVAALPITNNTQELKASEFDYMLQDLVSAELEGTLTDEGRKLLDEYRKREKPKE